MRRLLALILAAIAVFLVAPEATVTATSVRSGAVCTYDGHAHSAPSVGGTSERGPPTAGNHFAIDNAVDRRSHGDSTRSDIGESPAAYTYNDPARFVRVTTTTRRRAEVADDQLIAFAPERVAAKYGRDIPIGPASEDAWTVLNRVDAKGAPLPGYKGGKTFLNDGSQGAQVLPRTASDGGSITYREWDLSPNIKGVPRDARRLVTGSDGSAYYTTDHYLSFIQFR